MGFASYGVNAPMSWKKKKKRKENEIRGSAKRIGEIEQASGIHRQVEIMETEASRDGERL